VALDAINISAQRRPTISEERHMVEKSLLNATAPVVDEQPVEDPTSAESPLVEEELLVEDVSIDGMCGVY
jgi:mycofactocin precursor